MQTYALQARSYTCNVNAELAWQSRLILAAAYRKNALPHLNKASQFLALAKQHKSNEKREKYYNSLAEKFTAKAEFWRSRARFHEIRALKQTGRPLPPIGYDSQDDWQELYFDWITE